MRELTFTFWESVTAKAGKPITWPWAQWVQLLSEHEARGTKDGPCLTLCTIPAGMPRKNKSVLVIDALCLDIDHGTEAEIVEALAAFRPFEYVIHSTYSHGKPMEDRDQPQITNPDGSKTWPPKLDENGNTIPQTKIRAVVPLATSVTAAEHRRLWTNFSAMAKGYNDERTKAASHPFYLPAHPLTPFAEPFVYHNAGKWLDPAEYMAAPTAAETDDTSDAVVQENLGRAQGILRRMPAAHELRAAATALTRGVSFAEPGERHDTARGLTGFLAFKTLKRPLAPRALELLFAPSLAAMQTEDPTCETVDQVIDAYETAVQKATEQKAAARAEEQRKLAIETSNDPNKAIWSREDLKRCAELQNGDPDHLAFVVQRSNAHYILQRDGAFGGPYSEKDAAVEVFQTLATAPIALYDETGDGGYRALGLPEIVRRHGRIAQQVEADLSLQQKLFDCKTRTMREAVRPIRTELNAIEHPEVDKWIRLFTQTDELYNKINRWLACCPDLHKMLCAVTLAGLPGTGKGLFAQGVASIWAKGGAASSVENLLGGFNEDVVRCPVVFADEALPKVMRWESVTTKLRAEIATLVRTLNRKYLSTIELHGSLRFVLATNNPMILASNISTAADLTAIAQRFLYVEMHPDAERYLMTLNTETKNEWRCNTIAEHVLWLRENLAVEPEGRLWVMGDVDKMHRLLVTSSDWNSWVCEWVVNGLKDGFRKLEHKTETTGLVKIRDGKLYVATAAITEGWITYVNYAKIDPDPRRVAMALRSISVSDKPKQLRPSRARFFEVDPNHVKAWAEENGVASPEEITEALVNGIKEMPTVVDLDKKRQEKGDK